MTSKKAFPTKVVWILGAGASVSETYGHFPSLLGIPEKARELGVLDPKVGTEPGLAHLARYLRSRSYGDLTDPGEPVNLERVLTLLEIDIAVASEPRLLLARKFVLRLLRLTLIRLHKSVPRRRGEYIRLVSSLGPLDTIITFNWDFLLDEALGRSSRLKPLGAGTKQGPAFQTPPNLYDKFLLELTGWGEQTWKGMGVPGPVHKIEDAGHLIKAHGSIDWYYCSNPGCRSFETVFPLKGSASRPKCSGCRERTEVLIIPPTLNKRLREVPLTRRLWTLAASEMAKATRLIVWGYSLPPTDFFSDWLLRQARSSRCKSLVLINPSVLRPGKPARMNEDFVAPFITALRRPGRQIAVSLYVSFEQYEAGNSALSSKAVREQLRDLN